MIARLIFLVLLACIAMPARAAAPEFRQFKQGEPITLRADRAYILMRLDTDLSKFDADLLRVPDSAEMAAYEAAKRAAYDTALAAAKAKLARNPKSRAVEQVGTFEDFQFAYTGAPNLYALRPGRSLLTVNKVATVLAEVPPGDYVVYGEGFSGYLYQCFCLGTVRFAAPPGEVVDTGTMLFAKAWEPSPVPELAGEVGLGRSAVMDYGLFAVAIRPATPGLQLPPGLDPARVKPARYRAVGPFVDTNVIHINRLAAMPGVLAYDQGNVIDVPTGKVVEPD